MSGLSQGQVLRVVNDYIGVQGGYLGDFSYRTHQEFYPLYCDLDGIDPYKVPGTTRESFIEILLNQEPADQAKILRGLFERFPVDAHGAPDRRQRTATLMEQWINELERERTVAGLTPRATREVVVRAIADAESLIGSTGATSGVDRVHTALHGHLLALCEASSIETPPRASLNAVFRALRTEHPQLQEQGPRSQDIQKVLNSTSAILDALDPVRNRASVAHPNQELLAEPEAMLVVNVGRTLLNYLDAKLGGGADWLGRSDAPTVR